MNFFSKAISSDFFDSWEIKSEAERQEIMRQKLADYIEFCLSKLPYYQYRLSGYAPKAEFPLAQVEPMSATDLRSNVPPLGNTLITQNDNNYTVFQSGGTTGMPKTTLFSHHEIAQLDLPNSRGFFAVGLTAQDRVANQFAVGGLYMTFVHINRILQQYGCMNFPFANNTPADFVYTVTKLFKINCFAGIASVVLTTLRSFVELGLDGLQLEKVFFGGEHIYDADVQELKSKLGVKTVAAPGYGTVDTWYVGYQCQHTPLGVFHAHDDQVYMEIVDPQTGKHCEPGVPGMLYVTPFPRRLMPVVRYRVGDRAKWLPEKCACGRTTPLFRLLGRGDDILRIGYDSVDYSFVQEMVSLVSGLSGTVQMEKMRIHGKDSLVIRVETELPGLERIAAAKQLEQSILKSRPSLKTFIEKGTVCPLQIELVDLNSLSRNKRTGKLLRVIDAVEDK